MYNENKVNQVVNAIKENGLNAMDDEGLAKLLSILSPEEFDDFEIKSFSELGGIDAMVRINSIKPLVETMVKRDLSRIRTSDIYKYYLEALKTGRYSEFFKSLTKEEIADLKKYIYYTINPDDEVQKRAGEKIVKMLTREILDREAKEKPHF